MNAQEPITNLLGTVLLLATAGLAAGVAYFASLRRAVHLAVARGSWSAYVLLALGRIAAAGLFFIFAVHWGVPGLLAAFAGFLAARALAVRSARRSV